MQKSKKGAPTKEKLNAQDQKRKQADDDSHDLLRPPALQRTHFYAFSIRQKTPPTTATQAKENSDSDSSQPGLQRGDTVIVKRSPDSSNARAAALRGQTSPMSAFRRLPARPAVQPSPAQSPLEIKDPDSKKLCPLSPTREKANEFRPGGPGFRR